MKQLARLPETMPVIGPPAPRRRPSERQYKGISVRLTNATRAKLEDMAASTGLSLNRLVNEAVERYLVDTWQ